jgi:tetratricopeptide (TPR) repeat protein
MRVSKISAWMIGIFLVGVGPAAYAQDLIDESVPHEWIEEYLPEKLPALKFPEYFNDLDKAREQVYRGRYKTALITLNKIPADKKFDPAQVATVKASALAHLGRRDEAIAVVSDAAVADDPKVQVLHARILGDSGKWDEGLAILKKHLEKNNDSLTGHFFLAELSERIGDLDTAREHYEWIYKTYYDQWQGQGAKQFEDAEMVTLMGKAFDRHATLNNLYANNAPLNNIIFKVFVQAFDIIDRDYWPAHVAAAQFYVTRENAREAMKELKLALEGNPQDPRSIELMGLISLDQFNFDGAEKSISMLRKLDKRSIRADLLDARNLLQQRRPKDAQIPLRRVVDQQPKNIEALGLLAASYALRLEDEEVKKILAQVEQLDPDNHTAYFEVAEQLSSMRQYPRAEAMYRKAIERAGWWNAARNGLGLLLTQSGDEENAKSVLDAAYAIDPFNFRTTNYLILLDKLARMDRKETEHFVLMYDAQNDPLIAEYFSDYLESIHKDVTGHFKHEPAVKTYIEVFPSHDAFSARITGSPWIGTVGASTGRVIALCTPRKGENTMGAYNWAQVLRHEYTHTVTLSATDNRIGHWMTEGLAVFEEYSPLRWEWVPMLYNAVKKKELFSMENLTWAFVRPKRPQDRSLAYAQSFWICKYIEEKWGHDKILAMMAEFAKGKSQEEVFPTVLNVDLDSFSKEFFAWTEKQVEGWGYDEATTKKYDELVEKAEELTKARQFKDAVEIWEAIVKLRPVDQLPHLRLAGLYLAPEVKDLEKAKHHLIRLHEVSLKDNRFAKRIARLGMDSGDLKLAEKYALESIYIDPYDLPAHELLLVVAEKTGNKTHIEREKRVIPVLTEWIKEYRKSTLIEGAPQP